VAEWQANQRFEDHVCPHQFHDDKDGPQNIGLLAIQPPKTAASPRILYSISLLLIP
jgi:hypothetical protein